MTDYIYSLVMSCPASALAESNRLPELLGHGPNVFSVPLGDTEDGPVTHYGLCTRARQDFIDMLDAATNGKMPAVPGMTDAEVASVVAGYRYSYEPAGMRDDKQHFDDFVSPLVLVTE